MVKNVQSNNSNKNERSSVVDAMLKPFLNLKWCVNPEIKCCHHLTNDWSLCEYLITKYIYNTYKSLGYYRKDNLKDEKEKLGRINERGIIYCYCVNIMKSIKSKCSLITSILKWISYASLIL